MEGAFTRNDEKLGECKTGENTTTNGGEYDTSTKSTLYINFVLHLLSTVLVERTKTVPLSTSPTFHVPIETLTP